MENIILENKNYKLIKVAKNKYNILDAENNIALTLEGNFTMEQLQDQFNNCLKNCIII
ncbi:hypothetical protein [Clostridium tetani]|uniref:hypothetical protein n=1 Tax=Clostridium tetani TaxID=1513 RepID=UPI000B0C6BE2|nr:hypothetical protein [Clostridium tetani]